MVWHTHMLNPRLYLEDTMRKGRGDIWASGLPWDLLASCFATDQFEYEVLETSRIAWTGTTGLSWDNVQDSMHVNVTCPSCRAQMRFPWTTSDFHYNAPSPTIATSSKSKSQSTPAAASPLLSLQERLNLIGHGLADGKPLQACQSCQDEVDADFLCFYKFIKDGHNLTKHRHCMPGTLLDPVTGIPELDHPASSVSKANAAMTVPNRLTREVLYPKANDMLWKYRDGDVKPTTAGLRGLARRELHECMTLAVLAGPQDSLSTLELAASLEQKLKVRVREEHRRAAIFKMISPKVRVIIRRMISQYTDNWSPFALDLRSAMLRQSLFIDKMYKVCPRQ